MTNQTEITMAHHMKQKEALAKLENLEAEIGMMKAEHWGSVGDIDEINRMLDDVIEFVGGAS